MAVEGRLEFIEKEMYAARLCILYYVNKNDLHGILRKRIEKQIQDMQTESETKKMEVYQLQTQMQQAQQ